MVSGRAAPTGATYIKSKRKSRNDPTYQADYRAAHRKENVLYARAYRKRNRTRVRSFDQQPQVRERKRSQYLTRKYGISLVQHNTMLDKQGHVCAICQQAPRDKSRVLRMDHDHSCNRTRGLLCHHCNVALGHLVDDPARCLAAARYLKKWRKKLHT